MNIIFVCTGNTCRSPMAEIILKNKIKSSGLKNYRVSSAGISAIEGDKISKNSRLALKQLGYKVGTFKSKSLEMKTILSSDIIICMTKNHKSQLANFPHIYTISELTGLGDIIDPYGGDLSIYVKTSHQLEDACNIILTKILEDCLINNN